ncbi:hypothetical protein V1477_005918 [Vespula maculifrons]|uniref:Uncharacterized protein n=1 Tax=Vespula maculifrons TaxID=7453 RepID=A0ABD2CKY3_VESMC
MEDGEIVWEEYSPFPRGKREEVERPKSTKLARTPSKHLKIIILDMLIFLGYVKEKSNREIVSQPTEIHRWDHGMIRDSLDEKRIKTTSLSVMHHCREIDSDIMYLSIDIKKKESIVIRSEEKLPAT